MSWFSTRPPTRSRASTTTTEAPRALSSRAAARPASPAPTTATSASRARRVGHRPDPTSLPCPRSHASRHSLSRARGGAPPQHADADDRKRRVGLGGCRHLAAMDRRHMGRRGDNPCPGDAGERGAAPPDPANRARMDERPAGARQARRASREASRAPHGDPLQPRDAEPAPPDTAGSIRIYRQPTRAPATAVGARCGGRHGRDRLPHCGGGAHGRRPGLGRLDRQGRRPHDAFRRSREEPAATEAGRTPAQSTPEQTGTTPDQAPTTDTAPGGAAVGHRTRHAAIGPDSDRARPGGRALGE